MYIKETVEMLMQDVCQGMPKGT